MNWALIIIPISILAILLLAVGYYFNRLVVLGNRYQNAFSQIDVQLKRRYDLIPNLVECVKGYLSHEKGTLEAVASAMEQLSQAEGALSGAVGRLIAVAESYPELKASQNMLGLQEELTTTENRVGFARQAFNDSVTAYNSQRQTFPCVLVASLCGFRDASLLQAATERERAAPEIKLD